MGITKSNDTHVRLVEINEEIRNIPFRSVTEDHKVVFGLWWQSLNSLTMWYTGFVNFGDYSSAVNAAMALGKFSANKKPDESVVSVTLQEEVNALCDLMWDHIRTNPKC